MISAWTCWSRNCFWLILIKLLSPTDILENASVLIEMLQISLAMEFRAVNFIGFEAVSDLTEKEMISYFKS